MNTKEIHQNLLRTALVPARILMLCVTMLTLGELTANAQAPTVVATVQSVGQEPVEYTDLEAAFAAAQSGDVVKLQADCTLAANDATGLLGKIIVGDGTNAMDVEFDLNGHTVTGSDDEFFGVATKAWLIIEDSGTGGSIVTSGENAIHNSGTLAVLGGSISGASCGIYSQGKLTVGGGTISGGDYGLYVEQGMTEVSGGSLVARGTNGIGMECRQTVYFLGLPTFDCTLADISLAADQKIEFANVSYNVPAKKIKVKIANEAPYTFTSDYGYYVPKEATGNLDPATIFEYYDSTAGLGVIFDYNGSEALIGKCYALSGSRVMFYRNGIPNPIAALEGEKITVVPDLDPSSWPDGKYFTGDYTSEQVSVTLLVEDYSGQPTGEGQFVMPTQDVTVNAGLGDQEEYVVDLSTAMSQTIPYSMILLLPSMQVGEKNCTVNDDDGNWFLDLNVDGINDLQVKDNGKTTGRVYYIERLSGEKVYQTNCRLALSYLPPMQYNSVFFKFEVEPVSLIDSWISLDTDAFTYDGTEHKPTVTVTDPSEGDVTDYFECTYSNNKNAHDGTGENPPTVTVTAKSGQNKYTGIATKTFTIQRAEATVTAKNAEKFYGEDDPELTVSISGIVDADLNETGLISYTISRELGEEPGDDYDITVSGDAIQGNYTVTFVGAKFSIMSAVDTENPTVIEEDGVSTTYYPLSNAAFDGLVRVSKQMSGAGSATLKKLIGGFYVGIPSGSTKDVMGSVLAKKAPKGGEAKTIKIKASSKSKNLKIVAKNLVKGSTFMTKTSGGKLKSEKKYYKMYKKAFIKNAGKVKKIKVKTAKTRGDLPDDMSDDEELVIDPDVEYEILEDCDLFFTVEFDDDAEELEIEEVIVRQPGDANGDDKVDAADLVEMVNAKDGHPSENYNQLNADIDDDEDITQDDIDVVVDLIME